MLKVVITGGSGFIGTNLAEYLLNRAYTILSIDKVEPMLKHHISFYRQIDILQYFPLENEIINFDPDVIIHLAAVTDLNGKSLSYYNANIEGTQNIINISAKLKNLKKVIYTSSMYVCMPGFIPEDYNTYNPHTFYGESKMKGELLVKAIDNVYYEWVIIRPTSIWGPWFDIPYIDFFKIIYQEKYFASGKACTKTYGFIGNTVEQIWKLMNSDKINTKTFYIGDNPPIQISEWADEISKEMGNGSIKKVSFFVLQIAAFTGDLLAIFKIKFPISSFRLKNMITNNILPLNNLYQITGPPTISRLEGVRLTLNWLMKQKGYIFKK